VIEEKTQEQIEKASTESSLNAHWFTYIYYYYVEDTFYAKKLGRNISRKGDIDETPIII
jgi:hypothetical protein